MLECFSESICGRMEKLPKYKPGNRNNTKGGMCMTDYEIIMIFLGILALLMSFGGLIINILTFLRKRK